MHPSPQASFLLADINLSWSSFKCSGIYAIKNNAEDKLYIGSSNHIFRRGLEHLTELKYNRHHNYRLQNAWDNGECGNFELLIFEEAPPESLFEREQHYLDTLSELYNLSDRAERPPSYRSPEWCQRIGDSLRGKKRGPLPPDVCEKISKALSGVPKTPEHNAKVGAANSIVLKGRSLPQETKDKMKGRTPWNKGKETGKHGENCSCMLHEQNRINAGLPLKTMPESAKLAMSDAGKRRFSNPLEREKQSVAVKKGWERKKESSNESCVTSVT